MGAGQGVEKKLENAPTIIIVGGGYGGTALARSLDDAMNVILIDRKDYFHNNVGALRSVTNAAFTVQTTIPYTKLLKNGHVLHAEVTKIDPEEKKLYCHGKESGIPYTYLAICTGSAYSFPRTTAIPRLEDMGKPTGLMRDHMLYSERICIVGGGPCGVELLGEIKHAYPDKHVTIIDSHDHLMGGYDHFGQKFHNKLNKLLEEYTNVEIKCGEKVVESVDTKPKDNQLYVKGKDIKVMLKSGQEIECDMVFWTMGAKVNSRSFSNTLPMNDQNRLDVDEYFQVKGYEGSIWAFGDCAGTANKMAYFAGEQAKVIAGNIKKTLKGKKDLKIWKQPGATMILPMGPEKGVSILGSLGTWGNTTTSKMKGKDLFCGKQWKDLGFKKNEAGTKAGSDVSFKWDKEDKQKLRQKLEKGDAGKVDIETLITYTGVSENEGFT